MSNQFMLKGGNEEVSTTRFLFMWTG